MLLLDELNPLRPKYANPRVESFFNSSRIRAATSSLDSRIFSDLVFAVNGSTLSTVTSGSK
jgi:hypothetical protein